MKVREEHALSSKAIELASHSISTQRLHQLRGKALKNEQIDIGTLFREQLLCCALALLGHFTKDSRCFLVVKESILRCEVTLVEQRLHKTKHRVYGSMIQFLQLAKIGFARIHRRNGHASPDA